MVVASRPSTAIRYGLVRNLTVLHDRSITITVRKAVRGMNSTLIPSTPT